MEDQGKTPNNPPIPNPGLPGDPLHERVTSVPVTIPSEKITTTPAGRAVAQAPAPAAKGKDKEKAAPPESKDGTREVIDTIVIVVVLVLLLKTFLAEAFVIPTGSMATTLLGYHKQVNCPACGHQFELNLSKEVDAAEERNVPITGCTCPNCRAHIQIPVEKTAANQTPEQ